MDFFTLGYWGMFLASFISATVFPLASEALLLLFLKNDFNPTTLIAVATIGNTLGGVTNYIIGYFGNPNWLQKFGMSPAKIESFKIKTQKYGAYLAFLSWVPIIGDPITIALGFFKVPFKPVLLFMLIGKFLRYLLVLLPFL